MYEMFRCLCLFLAIHCNVQSIISPTVRLPGVNHVELGYDGAKMLSVSEQRPKFRIFNLSEQSSVTLTLDLFGKTRTYGIPLHVETKDIDVHKLVLCESISYTFEQFYENYFRSTSFGTGVSPASADSLSAQYHEILKRAQQAIDKYSEAVGTSTAWVGLYAIQLLSPSLLKFDSVFNNIISGLVSEASNPTTEDQQLLYNEFVKSYGTHYVSQVIVGGVANLYTFISKRYHNSSTYEKLAHEISLMTQYNGFLYNTATDSRVFRPPISEPFVKNTTIMTVYQPPMISSTHEAVLRMWLSDIGEQPTVVNRTLVHMANLVTDKPQVEMHLRRTIDFYLKNGFLPTLAQLNFRSKVARSMVSVPVGPISGLNVVGCGYDVLSLESRSCLLDMSNSSANTQWIDPYNTNISYTMPDGFFAVNTPESLTIDATMLVTSVEDYFQKTTRVESWKRRALFGSKTVTKRITDFYRRFYQEYYNLVLRLKQIGWYTLVVSTFPYPKLNRVAEEALNRLPIKFSPTELSLWEHFFTAYGTHMVVASQMGGQVWAKTWYEKCLTYERSETWIDEQVSRSFLGFKTGEDLTSQHDLKIDELFKRYSTYESELRGGTDSIAPEKWEEWALTVKDNPQPISYRLISLDELLPQGDRRLALKAAIEYFLTQADKEAIEYISQLESIRGPSPTKCSRNRVRRQISPTTPLTQNLESTTTTSKADLISTTTDPIAAMVQALCPYVGYNGLTCAKPMGKQGPIPVYKLLPTGVGITIDITTGKLLLPAVDFTNDNVTSWKDNLSDVIYLYPREVSLLKVAPEDNAPVIRIFRTAGELSNEWKYGRLRGSWLGGEFGHSKTALDIQQQFFSDNQATAITQKPQVLYRLKIETLRLNRFVQSALDKLTAVYDETLYSDFIRNWGTHIVQQSLVGGMREQQVRFKDCVFSFTGAITRENLETYLKQDLLSETLGNTFYANRRKISLDHRLGGNPALSNTTEWLRTLGENPALLKTEEYTPWYDVVTNPAIKANLRRIIKNRTDAADIIRIREETQVNEQLKNARILSLQSSVGFVNNGRCQVSPPVTLDPVANCSLGCATSLQLSSLNGFFSDRPLLYMRDPATGFTRARVQLENGAIINGPRVDVGCSVISTPSLATKAAYICVGCTLINLVNNACTCACPEYSS